MQVQGTVERIGNRRVGSRTVYSIQVEGQWYGGIWNNEPNCKEGDFVTFEAEENKGYWNAKAETIRVSQQEAPAPRSSGSAPVNSSGDRQASIVYQSSRANAIALVTAALQHDALPLPTKKADKFSALVDIVKELTDEFAYDAIAPEIMSPDERLQAEVMDEVSGGMDEE